MSFERRFERYNVILNVVNAIGPTRSKMSCRVTYLKAWPLHPANK